MLDADAIGRSISLSQLVDCLELAFRGAGIAPIRQVLPLPGGAGRLFAAMPAFEKEGGGVVKLATLIPDNPARGLPAIQGVVVVFSRTGTPVAVLDGAVVTRLRTAAASALASRYLSRSDSSHLVVIGTGALAPVMARGHCVTRPITRISVWGRSAERAEATVATLREELGPSVEVRSTASLESSVRDADIVTCATSSSAPLLLGHWLRPGTYVDLVGSFSPKTREADDDVVRSARIFVDTREGALAEAGDLLQPLASGVIRPEQIVGELADLVCARVVGRTSNEQIVVFKSVGAAVEDLAASQRIVAAAASLNS